MCVVAAEVLVLPVLLALLAASGGESLRLIPAGLEQRIYEWKPYFISYYGHDITLYCSADSVEDLTMNINETYLQTQTINASTIQTFVRKPDIGQYRCRCSDSDNRYEGSLTFIVLPAMSVVSPHGRLKVDKFGNEVHVVHNGDDYKIYCTGNDGGLLQIRTGTYNPVQLPRGETVMVKAVNESTVMFKVHADVIEKKWYSCDTDLNDEFMSTLSTVDVVIVDGHPEAQQFRCVLYSKLEFDSIECTWKSISKYNSYKLFFVDFSNIPMLVCSDNSEKMTKLCAINDLSDFYFKNNITYFLMESCNEYCYNQTFLIDWPAIIKLDPPSYMELKNISSRSVVLGLTSRIDVPYSFGVLKVEYRLVAPAWHEANTSTMPCEFINCDYQISLPCPDSHYEFRVSVKASRDDGIWSDPAFFYFFTTPSDSDDELDHVCKAKFTEQEPLPSIETVSYEIRKLVSFEREEDSALKRKVAGLKQKRAEIKALMESISKSNANE